jgi:dTDP-4-amino-4,6-dideoxygalactose transaminase
LSDHYVPFNRTHATGAELRYIEEAVANAEIAAGGPFAARCREWLEDRCGCARAILTHTGTHALELAALLAAVGEGDEVVMPSFTFPSTANAFVLRGAVPVFVDIREDTLNLDEAQVADALSPRTRAIVPVHYGGVGTEMDAILDVARLNDLIVVEDASHALPATYRGRELGSMGQVGVLSFHETKNVSCGEGGALLVNDDGLVGRAEVLQDKGTNRAQFLRGEVDRYSWKELGSSFAASDIAAAYLWAQLQEIERITAERMSTWDAYHRAFERLEREGAVRRPLVPEPCTHNAHLYYLLVQGPPGRDALIDRLEERGVNAVFHYVPLHSAPAGRRYGRAHGELEVTDRVSASLVRLPLWAGMGERDVEQVVDAVHAAFSNP